MMYTHTYTCNMNFCAVSLYYVARFPWTLLKPLFVAKLEMVMGEFSKEFAVDQLPPCPNVDNAHFDVYRTRIMEAVHRFSGYVCFFSSVSCVKNISFWKSHSFRHVLHEVVWLGLFNVLSNSSGSGGTMDNSWKWFPLWLATKGGYHSIHNLLD